MIEIIKKFGLNQKLTLIPMLLFNILSTISISVLPFILVLIFDLIKTYYMGESQLILETDKPTSQFGLEGIFIYLKQIFSMISEYSFLKQLIILVIFFLFFSLISSLFLFISRSLMEVREVDTRFKIRKNLRSKILEHDILDFTKNQLGYYQSMFIKDVEDLSIISGKYINAFCQHSIQIIICMYFLFSTNIYLTVALILIFLLHLLYNKILNKPVFENTKKEYEASGHLSGKIIDYLNNFKTFKILYGHNDNLQKTLDKDFIELKKRASNKANKCNSKSFQSFYK